MKVLIYLEGHTISFPDNVASFTILDLKEFINEKSNGCIPVEEINLFRYPGRPLLPELILECDDDYWFHEEDLESEDDEDYWLHEEDLESEDDEDGSEDEDGENGSEDEDGESDLEDDEDGNEDEEDKDDEDGSEDSDEDNRKFEFVVTLGNISTWSYFYVRYLANKDGRLIKIRSSKFATVASLKDRVSALIKQPVSCFKMKDKKISRVDDANLYHCGIVNGTILDCVVDVPQSPQ